MYRDNRYVILPLVLTGVLGGVIGPALLKELKKQTDNNGGMKGDRGTAVTSKMSSSNLTTDTNVPSLQDENNLTPTTKNKSTQATGDPMNQQRRHSEGRSEEDEDNLSVVTWDPAFTKSDSNSNINSNNDKPSNTFSSTRESYDPLMGDDSKILTGASISHRRNQSCGLMQDSSLQDASLLNKEMDGNLIDSNLEPHYSNLIDSANAPIFGVDGEGVS